MLLYKILIIMNQYGVVIMGLMDDILHTYSVENLKVLGTMHVENLPLLVVPGYGPNLLMN